VQDITERTEIEQQLWQAQKMEAVGRLAGGVAHDFNNLLTAILGYAELLLSDLRDDDPRSQDLREIRKAGVSAASLTRKILAFSRKQPLEPEVLDLNAVVRSLHGMLGRLIGEDIRIEVRLAPDLGRVKADPGQIEQVLLNLATNARDAMPQGGTLTIDTQNAGLDDTAVRRHLAAAPGEYVMLAVSDTGCGMPPEVQARVFEPFFTTKPRGIGTGLGLSTVYGIVKQSGGDISVYSEPGRGATFKVYLPRVDGPVGARPALVGPDVPVSGSETILLVEDNRGLRELARKVLERLGYAVLDAADADQALHLSEQHAGPIHLLLTDVVMPGMSGVALVERLTPTRPAMKVLYMSGYTDEAVVAAGVLPQRVTFLQKPFTPDSLARKVRQVLDAARTQ
jgi:nitrogen-specific signal transduction histidine kinase/CheY-like chemotaxis protein